MSQMWVPPMPTTSTTSLKSPSPPLSTEMVWKVNPFCWASNSLSKAVKRRGSSWLPCPSSAKLVGAVAAYQARPWALFLRGGVSSLRPAAFSRTA